MTELKSPLRYPGGKSRAIQHMKDLLPGGLGEYREPFVGGGSFFIYLKQKYPELKIWINDLNEELYWFWIYTQKDSETLAREVTRIRNRRKNGQKLFDDMVKADVGKLTPFDRAIRFFILNRITFSGVVESGGYSQLAYETRFTVSSIERLAKIGQIMQNVTITNHDYSKLLKDGNRNTFTFLDPPYLKATKSRLYGKNGQLHIGFNHDDFAHEMKQCKQSWLVTYDDSPEIRSKFAFANIRKWELQYGMNNYKQSKAEKGNELFIANYDLPNHLL